MEKDATDRQEQAVVVVSLLKKAYPKATTALKSNNSWELLVAVILSAQCTDKKVNEVTSVLFKKYKTLYDYTKANILEFEKDIRSTGFYRNKAKNILNSAKIIQEKHHGKLPRSMEELISLPGVARKTANIVLGSIYGKTEGIAVDTHVSRVIQRLRLVSLDTINGKKRRMFKQNSREILDFIKDASPDKIEQQLMDVLPKKEWLSISYRIIEHGRAVCIAQNPHCKDCVLSKHCPVSRVI